MAKVCPCLTIAGHQCTRPIFTDYPFCGTHLNQLIYSMGGNSFKRGRVLRTSFSSVDESLIHEAIEKWENEFSTLINTDPNNNHELLIEILRRRGRMTVSALTECFNGRLQTRCSPTQIGRAMTSLVESGLVIRSSTRSKTVTVHKTTTYELST